MCDIINAFILKNYKHLKYNNNKGIILVSEINVLISDQFSCWLNFIVLTRMWGKELLLFDIEK